MGYYEDKIIKEEWDIVRCPILEKLEELEIDIPITCIDKIYKESDYNVD